MGFNPRFARWQQEDWQGYAPTIGKMSSRGWWLSLHCGRCRVALKADVLKIIRLKGRDWSPWGKSAPCPVLHCPGRMRMRGYDPRSNHTIDI